MKIYRILYLPEAIILTGYLTCVDDTFTTKEKAREVIEDNRIVYAPNLPEQPVYINSVEGFYNIVPHHLLEIIEVS